MSENPEEHVVSFVNPNKDDQMKVKATENTAQTVETKPIDRVDVEKKIKAQENDIEELRKSGRKLQNQLSQIEQAVVAKMGAVAGLKDLLGNGS